jgi:aldose sugar dehydrogenase
MKNLLLLSCLIVATICTKAQNEPFTKTVLNNSSVTTGASRNDYSFQHPFDMFLDPINTDTLWINERIGKIYKVNNANGGRRLVLDLSATVNFIRSTTSSDQDGMFGMALHPNAFKGLGKDTLYVAYCYLQAAVKKTRIAKYYYNPTTKVLSNPSTLIEGLPASNDHNGGKLVIGPDFKLYYSCGDQGANQFGNACIPIKSQNDISAANLTALDYTDYAGHILRMNLDGTIPTDNPLFSGVKSHAYTKGHRNPQGLSFEKDATGNTFVGAKLFSSEQGAVTDDEINIIESGKNYGWPRISGKNDNIFYTYKNWSLSPVTGTTADVDCGSYPGECGTATNMTGPLAPVTESSWATPSQYTEPLVSQYPVASPDCSNWLARPTVAWSAIEFYNYPTTGIPGWNASLVLPTLKRSAILRYKLNGTNDGIMDIAGATNVYDTLQYFRDNAALNRFRDIAFSATGTTIFAITDTIGATSGPSNGSASVVDKGKLIAFKYTGTTLALPNYNPTAVLRNDLVKTYPNPVANLLLINTTDLGYKPFEAKLYNAQGNLVKQQSVTTSNTSMDVSKLSNGLYIFTLTNKYGIVLSNKKIVVAK